MKFISALVQLAYAQIDLRYATISIRDGGNDTQSSTTAGATAIVTATTITVAALGSAPAAGQVIQITTVSTGAVNQYVLGSGSTTTSLVLVSPGLKTALAISDPVVVFGATQKIAVKIGTGTLTYSEKKNIEYTLDRGILSDVREGDDVPVDVKMQFIWEYIKGTTGAGGVPSVEDALKKIGKASTWVSADPDLCRPYCVDIEVSYIPNCTGADRELILLEQFRWEDLTHDLKAGTVSVSGKCNVKQATILRMAN